MKKFLKSTLVVTIIVVSLCILSLFASATEYEHEHTWETVQTSESFSLQCNDCNTTVLIYNESWLCEHEFESFGSSMSRGEKCIHCGYTVQTAHQFETYFDNGVHIGTCINCGYTETHPTSIFRDETGHSFVCQECNDELTVAHETGVNMFSKVFDDDYHGYECVDCGYSVSYPHTFLEIGFVDGTHLIECTGCDLQIYHSITKIIDEFGHYTKCDVCDKVETEEHSEENMTFGILNENFHYYECNECGFIKCLPHTTNCECGFAGECLHMNAKIVKLDDYKHSIECPDCLYVDSEEHNWETIATNEDSSEIPVYCTECHHTGTCIVEYGILLSHTKNENGNYTAVILTNGMKRHYIAHSTRITSGSFVRVKSVYGKCDILSHRVDAEVMSDLGNIIEYLYSSIKSEYRGKELTLDSITVSNVNYSENDEFSVEFKNGFRETFITSDVTIYNMTSGLMEPKIKENDIILYFTPEETNETIIVIIG